MNGKKIIEGLVEDACLEITECESVYGIYTLRIKVNDQNYRISYDTPIRVDRGERVRIWEQGTHPSMGFTDKALQILDEEGEEIFCYKLIGRRRLLGDNAPIKFLEAKLEPLDKNGGKK